LFINVPSQQSKWPVTETAQHADTHINIVLTTNNKQDANETDNKTQKRNTKQTQKKTILQEKSHKRSTGIKTVNPDRNVDTSTKKVTD
jgi:hypothetical protein